MECKFAFLCDYAEREQKLHAIGIGWDTLSTHSLPFNHPVLCFVASLRGSLAEMGTKTVCVRLIDADGHDVIPPLHQQVAFEIRPPQLEAEISLVINLNGIEFKKYGTYAIHLVVQGNEMASVPFNVIALPATA